MPDLLKNSWNAGELGSDLVARVDLAKYPNAAAEMTNIALYRQGGWGRRPGTWKAWETKNDARAVLQDMKGGLVLELTDKAVRFGKDLGRFDVASTTASITNGSFASGLTGWSDRSVFGTATATTADSDVDGATGTVIGNVNGGLNAFDGSTSTTATVTSAHLIIGKTWASPKKITNIRLVGSSSDGFVIGSGPTLTVDAYGSNDVFATDSHYLGTVTVDDAKGRAIDFAGRLDVSSSYSAHRIIATAGGKSKSWAVAEMTFTEAGVATGTCALAGTGNSGESARIEQTITSLVSGQTHVLRFTVSGRPVDSLTVSLGAVQDGKELATRKCFPGTHTIEFTPTSTSAHLLFTNTGKYTINVTGVSLLSGVPLEMAHPWSEGSLEGLQTAPSADVLFVASGTQPLSQISHYSDGSWAIEQTRFVDGPWLDDPESSIVITPSAVAVGGSVTLTASADLWTPQHVGALWRLPTTTGKLTAAPWVAATTYSNLDEVTNDGHIYRATAGATSGTIPPTHTSGTVYDKKGNTGVPWEYLHDGYGTVLITAYTSATSVTARVLMRLPTELPTSGTKYWREGAFSYAHGWPTAVAFYESRLILADDADNPGTLWFSATDDYTNFALGTEDDSSIKITMRDSSRRGRGDVNKVRWISASGQLLVGTEGGPWVIRSSTQDGPITSTSITARPQTTAGCAAALPCVAQDIVLYLSRNGRRIYELAYDLSRDRYVANDISVINALITGQTGILRAVAQEEPWSVLYYLRQDGQLAVLLYDPQQQIAGWTRWTLGGTDAVIESILAVPGSTTAGTDDRDVIYLSVARTINGATRRFVEYLDRPWQKGNDKSRSAFVDCASLYDGASTDTLSGLDYLEGETVRICADGTPDPDATVDGGALTLSRNASVAVVGLPYEHRYESLKIGTGTGSVGQKKNVTSLVLVLEDSYGGSLGRSAQDGNAEDLLDIAYPLPDVSETGYGALFTGELPVGNPGTWGRDPRLVIKGSDPMPFNVLAISLRVEVSP